MEKPMNYKEGQYLATSLNVCLDERNAMKIVNFLSALTNEETIVVTYRDEKNGHGHTHIFASTGPVGEAEKKDINHWINKEGGTVYRKLPTRENDSENEAASNEIGAEIENNRSLERLLQCKFNEDNPLVFSALSSEQILNDANSL